MTAQALPPTWPMYRALVGVGMLCGLLIAVVFQGTRPIIERNRAAALEQAIFAVLPAAASRATFTLNVDQELIAADVAGGRTVHAGYDADGSLVGVAIEAAGMGYADTITILYGYSPRREAIIGFRVLTSKETPGLGDKIETEPGFLDNFVALDVSLDAAGAAPRNPVKTVKQGQKTEPWQIDGITGATISSKAIGDMLATSTEFWLPIINAQLATLAMGGGDDES